MKLPEYMTLNSPDLIFDNGIKSYIIKTTPPVIVGYVVQNKVSEKYFASLSMAAYIPANQNEFGCFLLSQLDNELLIGDPNELAIFLEKILKEMLVFYLETR